MADERKDRAARIALLGNVPVVPGGTVGSTTSHAPPVKEFNVLPPKTMHMRVGPPVDLDDLRGREINAAPAQATDRITGRRD